MKEINGIKYNKKTLFWEAWYSKRHPITRVPASLRRTRLKSRAEALRVRTTLIVAVEEKLRKALMPSWSEQIEYYLTSCASNGLSVKSIYNAEKCLKAATLDEWGPKLIDQITTESIRRLISGKYEGKSESHKKAMLKFIRLAFEDAVERGFIVRNPAPKMKFKIGEKLKTVLTLTQVGRLLTEAKNHDWLWYPHVTMALYTGMRNGELYALTWDNVMLEARQIAVKYSWNNKDGFKSTKSGDDRIVEIAPSLIPVLKELKLASGERQFVLPRVGRWDKGEQARELGLFLQAIGLPKIRFHDLRATWCTQMLSMGIEPVKVMKMGGWAEMKTMMRYMRNAGIDIRGITDNLSFHDPVRHESAKVLALDYAGSRE